MANYLHGTDWSHWQGESSVLKAQGAGIVFWFFKATQGTTYVDSRFPSFRSQAESLRAIWAPYHFFMANLDPVAQARHFHSIVGDYQGMPPVVDFELTYGVSKYTLNLRLRQFLVEAERLFGRKPIIYTRGYFWNYWMYRADDWSEYPIWVALYGSTPPSGAYMPADWDTWGFWQYTSKGHGPTYGVSSTYVDLNYCPWTLEELKEFGQQGEEPVPDPDPDPEAGYFESFVTATALNVRSGPGTSYPSVGKYLSYGDKVKVFAHEYDPSSGLSWARISDTKAEWAALKWMTMKL